MGSVKKDILQRVFLVYGFMLILGILIIVKMIRIQLVEGSELLRKTNEMNLKYFEVEAVRGNICASNGSLLATSVPVFEIRMDVACPNITDAYFNQNVKKLATGLHSLFRDKSATDYEMILRRERKSNARYFLIKSGVTYEDYKKLQGFPIFDRGRFGGGLIAEPGTRRKKPYGLLASRTIGYETDEGNVKVGLEGAYSGFLQGKEGKQLKRKINNGEWIPVFHSNEVEPESGKDIITTIDINLQDVAEDALYRHLEEHKAEWGCAVLMEVSTGYIKAIANLSLDKQSGKYYESFNHAVGASIEPGSTFKLFSVLALFEDGLVNLDDSVYVKGGVASYSGLEIKDVHPPAKEWISVREAFETSSNVGISQIVTEAYSQHPGVFIRKLQEMRLHNPLDVDIPGEGNPFLKDTGNPAWSRVSLPFMSIGYEVMLTPLHLLALYNAVANNGVMVKPLFVHEIRQAGKTVEKFEPVALNRTLCSSSALKNARSLLEGVVERGTAKNLNNSVYRIAGKTGTAQIADRNMGYNKEHYNASFIGYFPADDPRYSCIVVVSKPSTGRYYASSVAVPVFKEIADKVYATSLDIHPETQDSVWLVDYPQCMIGNAHDLQFLYGSFSIPVDTATVASEYAVSVASEQETIKLQPRIIQEDVVPNLRGVGAKDALYILETLGLQVIIDGRGFVKEQSLPAGARVVKGETITLKLEV